MGKWCLVHGANCFPELSEFAYDVSEMDFQCPCNPQENIHSWHSKAALDLAHINRIDVNSFSELFLRQTRQFPVFTNTFTEKFSIFFYNHDWPTN